DGKKLGERAFKFLTEKIFKSPMNTYTYLPIILSSIPTVLLSGFFLEWFSTHRAEAVAARLSKGLRKSGGMTDVQTAFQKAGAPLTPQPIAAYNSQDKV